MSCDSATMSSFWEEVGAWMASTGLKLVLSIVILLVSFFIINFFSKKISKNLDKKAKQKHVDLTVSKAITTIIRVGLKVLVILALVSYLGINTSAITAVIASSGVGIGLAVNGVLSNFAGGLILLLTRPFKIDDYIKTTDGDGYVVEGFVEEIKIYNTKIKTYDNRTIYLPNGKLSTEIIENYTEKGLRKLVLPFNISYKADFTKAQEIIKQVCEKNDMILKTPEMTVDMTSYNESSIELTCRVWLEPRNYWDVKFSLLENVKKAFDEQGIEIPYQQVDVHIKNDQPVEITETEKK